MSFSAEAGRLKSRLYIWAFALAAFDDGDNEQALCRFQKIADTYKIFMNIAFIRGALGNHYEELQRLGDAMSCNQRDPLAYFQRGSCHVRLGMLDQASADFNEARALMRGISSISFENLGLEYTLHLEDIIVIQHALEHDKKEAKSDPSNLLTLLGTKGLPTGIVFRPTEGMMRSLYGSDVNTTSEVDFDHVQDNLLERIGSHSSTLASNLEYLSFDEHMGSNGPCSDVSSTYVPSESSFRNRCLSRGASVTSVRKSSVPWYSFSKSHSLTQENYGHSRRDLNKAAGEDMMVVTTEITTIPCAGLRISYGRLSGFMAWRLAVSLDTPYAAYSRDHSVAVNFLLDTGSKHSLVPPECLLALGWRGSLQPGTQVPLKIQGVKTKCVIGNSGEAGRLCNQFLASGNLAFYYDTDLCAPVLFVPTEGERPGSNVPLTVPRHRMSLKASFGAVLGQLLSKVSPSS